MAPANSSLATRSLYLVALLSVGDALGQTSELVPIHHAPAGYALPGKFPCGIAAADLFITEGSGGYPDLAVVIGEHNMMYPGDPESWTLDAGRVSFFRNTGDWSDRNTALEFEYDLIFPAENSDCAPADIAFAHLDGDSFIDMVVSAGVGPAVSANAGIYVFKGQSGGQYSFAQSFVQYINTGPARSFAIADFNNDTFLDILVAVDLVNEFGDQVSALENDGSGVFSVAATVDVGSSSNYATGTVVADDFIKATLGQPKRIDGITGRPFDASISTLKNQGSFSFLATNVSPVSGCSSWIFTEMVSGKFTAGGLSVDLAAVSYTVSGVRVLHGNGTGAFTTDCSVNDADFYAYDDSGGCELDPVPVVHPNALDLGNLNGNSKPDIVMTEFGCGQVGLLLGKGNGAFQYHNTSGLYNLSIRPSGSTQQESPIRVLLVDLDDDGFDDIVTANYNLNPDTVFSSMSVLIQNWLDTDPPQ